MRADAPTWGAVGAAGLVIAIAALIPAPPQRASTLATVAWIGAVHAYVRATATEDPAGPRTVHARLEVAADLDGSIRSTRSVGAAMLRALEGDHGAHTRAFESRWRSAAPPLSEPPE